jgi:hypothetical protein
MLMFNAFGASWVYLGKFGYAARTSHEVSTVLYKIEFASLWLGNSLDSEGVIPSLALDSSLAEGLEMQPKVRWGRARIFLLALRYRSAAPASYR